jgi:hypothetical protein
VSVSVRRADTSPGLPAPGSGGRAAAALEGAGAFVRAVAERALRLAAVAAVAGAVAWWAIYWEVDPGDVRTAILVLAGLLLAFPPAALAVFGVAARTLASLPDRIRQTPGAAKDRAAEISRRAGSVAEARRRGLVRGLPAVAGLWWSVASARDVLQVLSPGAVLLRSSTLVAAAVALPAAVLEVVLGVAALLWLVL